ncbi:MAG: hypothetical protein HY018_14655 [Hydrogenophilales bacterium]|nr:hypothetical protein [Hydrogenophilales bacterium]
MNKLRVASALILGVLTLFFSGAAAADRGHWHGHSHVGVGVVVDPFWFDPWPYRPYYYPPYYYPPPVVTVPAEPPVYIERDASPAPQSSAYWYYCSRPAGYYPYVKRCPGGWQPVAPQPPPPPLDDDEEQ